MVAKALRDQVATAGHRDTGFPLLYSLNVNNRASYNASVKLLRVEFQMKPPWAYLLGDDAIGPRDSSNAVLVIYFSTHPLSFLSLEIKHHLSTRSHAFEFLAIIISKALKWHNKQHFHCKEREKQKGTLEYVP